MSLRPFKWLNLKKLAQCFVLSDEDLNTVYFFTAVTQWSPTKTLRHINYIKTQESKGAKVIHGRFHYSMVRCYHCGRSFKKFEEKQTDVNIAVTLLRLAHEDAFDKALIISGDSDLAPSILAVKELYPEKKIGVIIPITRRAEYLKKITDFHHKIKRMHLYSSLMESPVALADGTQLTNPYPAPPLHPPTPPAPPPPSHTTSETPAASG